MSGRPEGVLGDGDEVELDGRLDAAMERYVDGDVAAFDELYAGLARRIYGYLVQLVSDRNRADDLLQVTFLRLHAARGAWARGARVLPWVVTIARNAAYDELRARGKARVALTQTGAVPDIASPVEEDGPEASLVEALQRALDRLPERYREALQLTKQLDLSIKEAAAIVGTTETAMKLRVHRAYKQLRSDLGTAGHPPQGGARKTSPGIRHEAVPRKTSGREENGR